MSRIGKLYIGEMNTWYVLLKTRLGYIALDLKTGNTSGGVQRTIQEATYGLEESGYVLDLDRTSVAGRPYQEGEG